MARFQAQIRMGYYPTPLEVVDRCKTFIKPQGKVSFLDPCCGEGLALERLASGFDAKTYGIEIDGRRSEESKLRLDFVLKCGYEQAVITNNCFSLLLLNPPYDFETGEDVVDRKEKTFLKNTVRYLQAGGLLVYIIPQRRLDKSIAKILSYKFGHFKIHKFPGREYEAFNQIVVMAVKKKTAATDEMAFSALLKAPYADFEELPLTNQPVYELPLSKKVGVFRSTLLDLEALEKEVRDSALWQRIESLSLINTATLERPPLPLHTGHLGLLLATGLMDGLVETENREDRHIVRDKVEKVAVCTVEDKDGCTEERQLDRYKVSIKILTETGDIITLM